MMLYAWISLSALLVLAFLFARFRPILSLAIGAAATTFSTPHFSFVLQAAIFIAVAMLSELLLKPFWRKIIHRPKNDPRAMQVVGATGRIRDIVHARKEIFLLHCNGSDWIAQPLVAGGIQLGDEVEVVRVEGKHLRVRRRS